MNNKAWIDMMISPELLSDLVNYKSESNNKAMRVYRKCLQAKKYDLAMRIETKYRLHNLTNSDLVVSYALATIANSKS